MKDKTKDTLQPWKLFTEAQDAIDSSEPIYGPTCFCLMCEASVPMPHTLDNCPEAQRIIQAAKENTR